MPDKSNKGALTAKCSFTLSTYRIHFEGVGIFVFVLGDQIYIFTLLSPLTEKYSGEREDESS